MLLINGRLTAFEVFRVLCIALALVVGVLRIGAERSTAPWHPARGSGEDSAATSQGRSVAVAARHKWRIYAGPGGAHDFSLRGDSGHRWAAVHHFLCNGARGVRPDRPLQYPRTASQGEREY